MLVCRSCRWCVEKIGAAEDAPTVPHSQSRGAHGIEIVIVTKRGRRTVRTARPWDMASICRLTGTGELPLFFLASSRAHRGKVVAIEMGVYSSLPWPA